MYFSCKCHLSKILARVVTLKIEMKESLCMCACYLQQDACVHIAFRDSRAFSRMKEKMTFSLSIKASEILLYIDKGGLKL